MGDEEIVREFLVESYENMDRLDQDLIVLEKEPGNHDTLASILRTIHTIKGTSEFLAFNQLEAVTHVGESLLSRPRDGLITLTPEITTAMLTMADAVRQMLKNIEASGNEDARDDRALIANLTRVLEPPPATTIRNGESESPVNSNSGAVPNLGEILVQWGAAKIADVEAAAEQQMAGDPHHLGEILVGKGSVKPHDVIEALNTQLQVRAQSARGSTIRVDVG